MKPIKKFLILLCDQWRADQHWQGRLSLPSYDRLAHGGTSFTQAITASAACTPSRACLFSGKHAQETGVTSTSGLHVRLAGSERYIGKPPTDPSCILPLPDRVPNLGSLFRAAGFSTFYKGKWHLSNAEGPWPDGPATGLESYGFSSWQPPEGHGLQEDRWGVATDPGYVENTVKLLENLKNDGVQRWLVVSSLVNPHDIGFFFHWHRRFPKEIPDLRLPLPPNLEDPLTSKPPCQLRYRTLWSESLLRARGAFDRLAGRRSTREERIRAYQNLYAYLIQIADTQVGKILDTLEDTGQAEETCIVFTSDHGELAFAHGLVQKWYSAYEEALRVPLILAGPGIPQGKTSDSLVSSIDLLPTLLSLAGISAPTGAGTLRGVNLCPILRGEKASVQEEVLFASDDDIVGNGIFGLGLLHVPPPWNLRSLRTKEYKLTRYFDANNSGQNEQYELYDRMRDPFELHNLAHGPRTKTIDDLFSKLNERLSALVEAKYNHPPLAPHEPSH